MKLSIFRISNMDKYTVYLVSLAFTVMVNHTVVNLMSLYFVPLAFTVIVIFFHGAGMVGGG